MAGSAEERLDALNREIADLEEKQDAYVSVIAALTDQGLNTAAAKTVLKKIEDQLAALRVRTATFEGDARHV